MKTRSFVLPRTFPANEGYWENILQKYDRASFYRTKMSKYWSGLLFYCEKITTFPCRTKLSESCRYPELVETLLNEEEEIDTQKLTDSVFLRFLITIFKEIKQLFARISEKTALRDAELDKRVNTLTDKENALDAKIEGLNAKEEKITKILSGIEEKDILLTVNQEKINEINENIKDARMALFEWSQIEGGVNYPNARLEKIALNYGFRNGTDWTEEEQLEYYNFSDPWGEETFQEPLELSRMPWKPEKIEGYLNKQQAKLVDFEKKVNEVGSLLSEISKGVEESKGLRGPSL